MTEKELFQRKIKLDKDFEWNDENVRRILNFNDAVLLKYVEAWEKVEHIDRDFQKLRNDGSKVYEKYRIEAEVVYCGKDSETENWEELNWLEENHCYAGNSVVVEFDADGGGYVHPLELMDDCFLMESSWNIELFDRPEFKKKKISYFMHNLFCDGLFSLEDLLRMDWKNLQVIVRIEMM